ncbi:hypothetical protein, partial [Bradyrhizobium macuxiense]|uniref:hypothetical protein n=1 Tax=Bradyrhizobium macuxiense TaxID=1755647 RepID=UPI001AEC8F8B
MTARAGVAVAALLISAAVAVVPSAVEAGCVLAVEAAVVRPSGNALPVAVSARASTAQEQASDRARGL